METLFLRAVNLGLTAGWIVLAVLLLRLVFQKAPRWVLCALWGLAALRLVCPFSFQSALSLIPSAEPLPPDIVYTASPEIQSGIGAVDRLVNPVLADALTPSPGSSANPTQVWSFILSRVWAAGVIVMLLYALGSYLLLRRRVSTATVLRGNIRECDRVTSPFVLGIFRPKIFLPYNIPEADLAFILAHEQAHIRRKDHWWKPLGFLLLSVYWFHPLLWAAYALFCRDIEAACDEKVVGELDDAGRRAYSMALLRCSARSRTAACPLAFGETGVKRRIQGVIRYKKPALWIVLLAVLAALAAAVCLLTDPLPRVDSFTLREQDLSGGDDTSSYLYDLSLGRQIGSVRLWAEQWSNGVCTASSPETLPQDAARLEIRFNLAREGGRYTGVTVSFGAGTESTALTSFSLPEGANAVGWASSAYKRGETVRVAPGEEKILASLVFDLGQGVRVFDPETLLNEAESRLKSAEALIVVRAAFDETLGSAAAAQPEILAWFDFWDDPSGMEPGLPLELPEFPGVTFRYTEKEIVAETDSGAVSMVRGPIWNAFFYDATGDGVRDLCATYTFGSGIIDARFVVYDYKNGASYEMADRGNFDFILRARDGAVYVEKRAYSDGTLAAFGRLAFSDGALRVDFEETQAPDEDPEKTRETLSAYAPFGLTYHFEEDEDGGLRMDWNGKPVRSLYDAEKGVLIANSVRGLSLGPDAADLEAVYENGRLAGLREAQSSSLPETLDAEPATSVP